MTTDLSRKAYTIRIEYLNVSGMMANQKLASAVSNNCFYEIRRQLTYKQAHYGTKVELVDRWFPSSKKCSIAFLRLVRYGCELDSRIRGNDRFENIPHLSEKGYKCHHIQSMKLSDRIFICQNPDCGHIQNRDENAAINLECAPEDKVRLA